MIAETPTGLEPAPGMKLALGAMEVQSSPALHRGARIAVRPGGQPQRYVPVLGDHPAHHSGMSPGASGTMGATGRSGQDRAKVEFGPNAAATYIFLIMPIVLLSEAPLMAQR
jgi:hypothetical protein